MKLIDKKPSALTAARHEIEQFKTNIGRRTGHKGGPVTLLGPDKLQNALKDAWLVVEVRNRSSRLHSNLTKITRTCPNRYI